MNNTKKKTIFYPTWQRVMIFFYEGGKDIYYKIEIAKGTDITYSQVCLILNELTKLGLVNSDKYGRKCDVMLTDKGKEIVNSFKIIKKYVD